MPRNISHVTPWILKLVNPVGVGGCTPLYKLYRYVPPQRVWFLSRFGLKKGIDYGLKSGGFSLGDHGSV